MLLLAGSLAANSAGPACLVLACPMDMPCEEMAATAEREVCCDLEVRGFGQSCCDEDGLTAALRKPAGDGLAPSVEPALARLAPELPSAGRPVAPTAVPPSPPPDGGLYTLHSSFLI